MNAERIGTSLSLCKFSRSEILAGSILTSCPLKLTGSQHNACPCKQRRYHVTQYDLRVIECLFPKNYRGELIRHPEQFRETLLASMSKNNQKQGATTMSTTAIADPPKNGAAKETTAQVANLANNDLWHGIEIPIIGVCGEKWMGKTLFVSSIDAEHTAIIDLEGSSATYGSIPFARRWDLYDEMLKKYGRLPTPIECFEWFRDLVMALKPGEFRVLAVDPITDIEQGMVDWVQTHPEHFGHSKNQYDKAAGVMWGDVKSYWKMLLGIVATKVETFAFTAHMGAVWKGSAPVEGKRKAKGKETLFELASLYLQVERPLDAEGKQSDKPSARVLKSRLALSEFEDGEIVHKPILPPYLKVATPKAIREYIKNPPNYSKLKKTEVAPPEQLSEDDKLLIQAGIAEDQRVAAEAQLSRMEQMKRAAEEQARLKREREAIQAVNSATAELAASREALAAETITTATGTVLPASHAALAGIQEASDVSERKRLHAVVKDLCSALNMQPNKIADMLAKRGVKTIEELTLAQAEEVRGKLQIVINERAAKHNPPF